MLFLFDLNYDHKIEITEKLKADWQGIDHPLWRSESVAAINSILEGCLYAYAFSESDMVDAVLAAIILSVTKWNEEELDKNLDRVCDKIDLVMGQEGGMQ